jgi:hypothetical protein
MSENIYEITVNFMDISTVIAMLYLVLKMNICPYFLTIFAQF